MKKKYVVSVFLVLTSIAIFALAGFGQGKSGINGADGKEASRVPPCDPCPPPPPPTPTPQPPYNTVAYTSSTATLDATNGNKVVSDPNNNLHVVYSEAGVVKYVTSSDLGATWSFPAIVAASGINPSIGADDNNNLGVAYVSGNNLNYISKPAGGTWSAPVFIANTFDGANAKPSVAGYGAKIHIAWVAGNIKYTQLTTIAPVVTTPESLNATLLCGQTNEYRLPSIALSDSGTSNPTVRVAFYNKFISGPGCSNTKKAGIYVLERPASPLAGLDWDLQSPNMGSGGIYSEFQNFAGTTPAVSSVSLAANRTSKEFYLVSSYTPGDMGSLWRTSFAKGEPSSPYLWNRTDYFGGDISLPVHLDVTAVKQYAGGGAANGLFKTGYSLTTYGNVFIKQGSWAGTTPTYWGNGIKKSLIGRLPHVIDFTIDNIITGESKGINLIYEVSGEIRADFFSMLIAS